MLEGLKSRLSANGITAQFTEAAVEKISKSGFDPVYGARPLRRAIQSEIEDLLAEKMLEKSIKEGESITVDEKDGEFDIKVN